MFKIDRFTLSYISSEKAFQEAILLLSLLGIYILQVNVMSSFCYKHKDDLT